jgi:hypothetical protein
VIGFDTPMSADHGWGSYRLQIFADQAEAVKSRLRSTAGAMLTVQSSEEFFQTYLGIDVRKPLEPFDWLSISEQKLLTLTSGPLFHDEIDLEELRKQFSYYPRDVWLYQLASVWTRIGQEEHLVGRAGFVGDELGAKIIAARLVRDAMRLCFLMERQYAPYPKWLGSAFNRLAAAEEFNPMLNQVLNAKGWKERDRALAGVYEALARKHNRLQITPPRPEITAPFFDRPFSAIEVQGCFAESIRLKIEEPRLRRLDPIGGIDIFSDSTDLVSHVCWREKVKSLLSSSTSCE